MQRIANANIITCFSQCTHSLMLSAINVAAALYLEIPILYVEARWDQSPKMLLYNRWWCFITLLRQKSLFNATVKGFLCLRQQCWSRIDQLIMKSNHILGQQAPEGWGQSVLRSSRRLNLLKSWARSDWLLFETLKYLETKGHVCFAFGDEARQTGLLTISDHKHKISPT